MTITILLADDHRLLREGMRSLLEQEADLKVVAEAENGPEAVRLAREVSPDVAVVDIRMPGLNGIEATRRMLSKGSGTRVLALSMHSHRRFIVEMLRAGASGYLLKDCAFKELVDAVRAVAADGTDWEAEDWSLGLTLHYDAVAGQVEDSPTAALHYFDTPIYVQAEDTYDHYAFSETLTVRVWELFLEIEHATRTLLENNKCEIGPTWLDSYEIQIRREWTVTWYQLANTRVLDPWVSRVAGTFKVRGKATRGGDEYTTDKEDVEIRFPAIAAIIADANVVAAANVRWTSTMNAATPPPDPEVREEGFWIRLTTTQANQGYSAGPVIIGDMIDVMGEVFIDIGNRPTDQPADPDPNAAGAEYWVAWFHVHPPSLYLDVGWSRPTGPSSNGDYEFAVDQETPGIAYDYTVNPAPSGLALNDAHQMYPITPPARRPTP